LVIHVLQPPEQRPHEERGLHSLIVGKVRGVPEHVLGPSAGGSYVLAENEEEFLLERGGGLEAGGLRGTRRLTDLARQVEVRIESDARDISVEANGKEA
jgi:hypothetical protein